MHDEVRRLQILGIEIFKTLNDLNPKFLKDIFQKTTWLTRNLSNIKVYFLNN